MKDIIFEIAGVMIFCLGILLASYVSARIYYAYTDYKHNRKNNNP